MQPIRRRNFLQWIGAAVVAALMRPVKATAASPALAVDEAAVSPVLRTEHFEAGHVTLQSADPKALAAMLRDLHSRRAYDSACHNGQAGPHSEYLTGWINSVTEELRSRGHYVNL